MKEIQTHPNLRRFYWRWESALERLLPKPGSRILAALSGGLDSVILTWLLKESRDRGICSLVIGHVNHQLRPNAALDEEFVRQLAADWQIDLLVGQVNVDTHATDQGKSIEHAARDLRYQTLIRMAREKSCDTIALGHHMDDQAETVLLRLLRGAGPRGIGAMAPITAARAQDQLLLIRPFLSFRRDELRKIAEEAHLSWREDSSNQDTDIQRNRIRHELLPELCQNYNPRLIEALCSLAERQRENDELIAQLATDLFRRVKLSPTAQADHKTTTLTAAAQPELWLDRALLAGEHTTLVTRVLYLAYQELSDSDTPLGSVHLDALLHLVGFGGSATDSAPKEVHLPRRLRVRRHKDVLVLGFHTPHSQESS